MPAQFAFVPTDGSTMIQSPLRKLIRHHCMKERNKQPNSRRARQTARKTRRDQKDKPEYNRHREIFPRPTTNNVSQARRRPEWPGGESCNQTAQQPAVPPPPPSDWALFRFPGELDAVSQELMHKYFVRNPIRDPICPFELFNLFIDFGQDPFQCFRALTGDMLCFRATLLLTSACEDLMIQRPLSGGTLTHLRLLLPILHSRLSDATSNQTDLILFAVGIMVSIAVLFGDQTAMAAHAVGLRQIIHLRGGFRALDHNPMVQFSLDRLNFSSALVTQQWTSLYDSSIWKEPIFINQLTDMNCPHEKVSVTGLVDSRLEPVFRTLQETTLLFNKHFYRNERIEGRFAQQCLGFVHSQLLELDGCFIDGFSETLRLGMMAFLATTFRIPGLGVQRAYRGTFEKLQLSLSSDKPGTPHLHEKISIWIMIVRVMFTESRDGLQVPALWRKTVVHKRSWEEIRCCLKEVMWVDSLHDNPGKGAYNILATEG